MDKENVKLKWYLRPINVILLLFFALGPFALPLLYKSPKFNKVSKILLTIIIIVYTSYLMFISLQIGRGVYTEIEKLQDILK